MAQPAAPETGRLRGEIPDTFNGDRKKSELLKQQFKIYKGLNDNHEIMTVPYFRAMQFLSLIRGPLVDDWVSDQVNELMERATDVNNPVPRTEEVHWTALQTAFDSAFTDTAKKQNAHNALQQLQMRGDDLDSYVATFKHLAKQAGYPLAEAGTVHLFALNLKPGLMDSILHRDVQPDTFDEWVDAARTELQKYFKRLSYKSPNFTKYRWMQPRKQEQQPYRHPNDRTVPMDVDQPVFTQVRTVRRAYTEVDKDRFKKEGRCFYCDNQGHISKYCPKKKSQNQQHNPQYRPKPHWQNSGQNQGFNKRSHGQQQNRNQGYRKQNKPFKHTPQIRAARIEEVEDTKHNNGYETDVTSLAARTARLSDEQREQWVQEMTAMGINF
jgi:hypothetical protein